MNLEQKAIELLEVLEGSVPQALDLVILATFYESLFSIIVGLAFIVAAFFLTRLAISSKKNEPEGTTVLDYPFFPYWLMLSFGAGVGWLVSAICLLNWWNWIGIFYPALRVANDIIRMAGS